MDGAPRPPREPRAAPGRTLGLAARNVAFTVVVPGLGGVWVPWWILTRHGRTPAVAAWEATGVIAAGAAVYVWCVWNFAAVGRGTPGPWDAPSRVVATGPYRWVRNPIYLAALLVVLGEAWLYRSPPLLAYAGAMAVLFHLFVIGYEEPALRRRFGRAYLEYRRTVPRWIPRPPRRGGDTARPGGAGAGGQGRRPPGAGPGQDDGADRAGRQRRGGRR